MKWAGGGRGRRRGEEEGREREGKGGKAANGLTTLRQSV